MISELKVYSLLWVVWMLWNWIEYSSQTNNRQEDVEWRIVVFFICKSSCNVISLIKHQGTVYENKTVHKRAAKLLIPDKEWIKRI